MPATLPDPVDDVDRQRVIAQLRRAAEEGRLGPHELDQRVAAARLARSASELSAVLVNLRPEPLAGAAALGAAGYRPDDPLVLTGGFSRERRDGVWVVPPFIRAHAVGASVRVDCLQATAAAKVIDLAVQPGLSPVLLVLPDGWAVNTDRLGKGIGAVVVKVPREPAPGCPVFIAHGNVGAGRFKARPATRLERRRQG